MKMLNGIPLYFSRHFNVSFNCKDKHKTNINEEI